MNNEGNRKDIEKAALEWFDDLIERYERGAKEIARFKTRFISTLEKPEKYGMPDHAIAWTVNEIANINRNINLDRAVVHAVQLAITQLSLDKDKTKA